MELQDLKTLISTPDKLIPFLQKNTLSSCDKAILDAYEVDKHKVNNKAIRLDKTVSYDSECLDSDGNAIKQYKTQFVTRIAIPLQKIIVSRCQVFLTGGGVELTAKPTDSQKPLFDVTQSWWDSEQLNVKLSNVAESAMSERHCALVFFARKVKKGKKTKLTLKSRLYKPKDGYEFMPVYNSEGDMIAFGIEGKYTDVDNKQVTYIKLYTETQIVDFEQKDGGWVLKDGTTEMPNPQPHKYEKIPVVYFPKGDPEWADVQSSIDRLETSISNLCDTNDYFAAPILTIIGQALGVVDKGGTGQAIQLEQDAKAGYLTWDQVPEAIKFEVAFLRSVIYGCTQTPDFSFETLKEMGDVSGDAFQRMLIDAYIKAKKYQDGWYGEGVRRCINFSIAANALINSMEDAADLEVIPAFGEFRINSIREIVEVSLLANGNKPLISRKDATKRSHLTNNVDQTLAEMREDEERENEMAITKAGHAGDTSKDGIAGSKTKPDNAVTKKGIAMDTSNAQNAKRA
jgi:SPP1 family phage portal protein